MHSRRVTTNPLSRLFYRDPHREFFNALADTLEEALLVIDSDASLIATCNHAFLLLSGFSRAEIAEVAPTDLLPGETGLETLRQLMERRAGRVRRLEEVPFRPRSGQLMLVDLVSRPASPDGQWVLITVRPSEERRQETHRREAERERLAITSDMAELLLDGGLSSISTALGHSQKLLSAAICGLYRISPTSPDYVLDGPLPEPFPRRQPSDVLKPFPRGNLWTLGQRPEHDLHRAARAAGLGALQICPVGASNAWIGALVAGWRRPEDVPIDSEALMRLASNLFHAAIQLGVQQASLAEHGKRADQLRADFLGQSEAVADALLARDDGFNVIQANQAAFDLLGYQPGELTTLPVQDVLVGPGDAMGLLLDAVSRRKTTERAHMTLHRRDGTPVPVWMRAVPLPKEASICVVIVLRDLSERKAIENQVEFLSRQALLGEVTAAFAHEVRNPINNISTGAQLAGSRLGEDHPLHSTLDRIQRQCDRVNQLMKDVLLFAQPRALEMEPLDLGETIQGLVKRWEPRFSQAGVRCYSSISETTPLVNADPRIFDQVLVNLVTNALQAMQGEGTLSIALEPANSANERIVELRIADTGPGIPEDNLDRVFDPFFTTKKGGTGLGLAITRQIVASHKGNITVESFPGAGTVFTIRLPALARPKESAGHDFNRSDR